MSETAPVLALWAHPRSLSTVFERVMIERGDLTVLHEPFSYAYYGQGGRRQLTDMDPDPTHPRSYAEIRDRCLAQAADGPVFLKDMPYHCLAELCDDTAFLERVTHSFLIRDPARTIPSHHAVDPEVTLEEVGCEAQHALFETIRRLGGEAPPVVDAADLRREPQATMSAYCERVGLEPRPEALTWDAGAPREWAVWASWHRDAAESTGIQQTRREYERTVENDDRLRAFHEHHRPFYEALRRHRLTPTATTPAPGPEDR